LVLFWYFFGAFGEIGAFLVPRRYLRRICVMPFDAFEAYPGASNKNRRSNSPKSFLVEHKEVLTSSQNSVDKPLNLLEKSCITTRPILADM